jgi:translocation and assembly module TamB
MRRLAHFSLRVAVAIATILFACGIAGVLVIRSGWFQEKVRERIISEIQKSTSARVELGSFHFDWEHLVASVSPLVIHGTEPASEAPLFKAESVSIGLRVISMLERKIDLAWLRVDRPAVRIVFYEDGSTNLPPLRDRRPWSDDLLDLAVGRYDVNDGVLEYDGRRVPLNLRGNMLRIGMTRDRRGSSYKGDLSVRAHIVAKGVPPMELDTSAVFVLEKSRIEITRMRLAGRDSRVDLAGVLTNPQAPRGNLSVKAAIGVREIVEIFGLPIDPKGSAQFDGQLAVATEPADFQLTGRVNARGLSASYQRLQISDANVRADVRINPETLRLSEFNLDSGGISAHAQIDLTQWRQLNINGSVHGVDLREAARIASGKSVPWDGVLSGDVTLDAILGERALKGRAALSIAPGSGASPLQGSIDASFDQPAGLITLETCHLATIATSLDASGTLGRELAIRAQTANLNEILPVIQLASDSQQKPLPLKLGPAGSARFEGTITGPLADPAAKGALSISNATFENHQFDQFSADIRANRASVQFANASISRGATSIRGSGEYSDQKIDAQLSVRGAQLAEVLKEAGSSLQISGTASGSVRISGTPAHPNADVTGQVENLSGFEQRIDHLRAHVRYTPDRIDVDSGEASEPGASVAFAGSFLHAPGDWEKGEIRFEASTPGLDLTHVHAFAKAQPNLSARIDGKANGVIRLEKSTFAITALAGRANLHSVAWDRQSLGDVTLTADTSGADLNLHANAKVRDIKVDAQGSWKLDGDLPGSAIVRFSRASVASVTSVVMAGGPLEKSAPPFDGFIDGANANVSIALRKPLDFRAELTIPTLHISPQPTQTLRLGVQAQELVVENVKPIVIAISSREARVRSAEFQARETHLEAAGAVSFDAASSSDLSVRGSINLIILQLLNPDLVARGSATVQASIRGSFKDPQLNGRMDLTKASLYLGDLPNGVDNVNGSVIFDRNRATIEKLTAETGGGTLTFSGFLGFGTPLVYRLQAEAQKVRIRYPEDVSVTFNSNLALNGTSDASTVSGVIVLTRASFTPRADVAQIFAQVARPVATPAAPGEYIRGMQFDVKIESDPAFQLQTSLARDLQAEVDMRLRGTPLRPALLGTASVNQGEVEVFGNRYTVNRGDIRFLNPVRIDPIFDMDLETRARGVTVNIAIAGTMQKLNVNYSSDPPLQPREIIALLAVGRAPTASAGLNPELASSSTSLAEAGAGGGLISQAITAQLSSRFQRFFGASRIKIDPTAAGAEYLPQARLTVEQQVSKDVTLTYITNLNRTQEQIVQIEWDFGKQWSAVAVRDANGLFGVDFQYRKRFK